MKKINLAITGCMGRMGQQLIKTSKANKIFKLVSLTENRIINKRIMGIRPSLNTENAFKNTDVIVDFTIPQCTLEVLKIAVKQNKIKNLTFDKPKVFKAKISLLFFNLIKTHIDDKNIINGSKLIIMLGIIIIDKIKGSPIPIS